MAAVPGQSKPNQMTTERIQEMLEENFKFIRAIAEQQNLGRMQEVHQYQQKLQDNLMLLAAVADTYNPGATGSAAPPQGPPAAAAPAFRPQAPAAAVPNPAAALGQFPAAAAVQQAMLMGMQGAGGQAAAVQLTQQQLQAMQQALVARQQLQQPFQLQQALNPLGGLGLAPGGQPNVAAGAGGFQLPAPPPLNLGT